MSDKSLLKIIIFSSLITGAILGILPLIPKLAGIAFLLVMFFTAPFVIIYLHRLKFIKDPETFNWLVTGGIIGFCSFCGFALIYFPLALVLNLIFKIESFIWIKVIFVNIGFLLPMVILTGLLSALFNMFSAFMTGYLYGYLKRKEQ